MADGSEPPTSFRIWKWGDNDTLNGKVVLDRESAADLLKAYADHGVELAIDFEHQTLNAPTNGLPAPAAGWFRPEIRDDGLWATSVRWTDQASGYLKARQYRYFSPVALVDSKTRKPQRLMPMALTNWPATKNIEPLVARVAETSTENPMKTVLLALGLRAEADETEAFTAANKLRDSERAILSLAGSPTVAEALATVSAWKIAAGEVAAMCAQLQTQAAAADATAFDAAIIEAKAAALLAPSDAHKRNVAALAFKGKPEAIANLKSFVAALDPLVGVTVSTVAVKEPSTGLTVVALTPDELRIAKRMGVTAEAATKNKARLLAAMPSAEADTDDEDAA